MRARKKIYQVVIILIFIYVSYLLFGMSQKPSRSVEKISPKDIRVEASIEENLTGHNMSYEYILNVDVELHKDFFAMFYPYIDGLYDPSYYLDEDPSYYLPGSVGSGGGTFKILQSILLDDGVEANKLDCYSIGFYFPREKGVYKSRIYLSKTDWFESIDHPKLIVVYYKDVNNGQINSWSKIIEIEH